jgi:thioredoxin-like negative regulator of GroEL
MHMSNGRGALLSAAAAAVLLFSFTTVLNSAYRNTRRSRAEARYRHGMALFGAGHYPEAADDFRAALTYEHSGQPYTLALARSLMAMGQWSEAASYLAELSEDDPTNGPVNLMLARIAVRDRHDPEAITYYQRAIYGYWSDHPDENRIAARFELVSLLDRSHQGSQALAELLQLAAEVPAKDEADRQRVAGLLLSHGASQQAADLYHSILAANPDNGAVEEGLGDARFAMADYAGARSAYRAAKRDGIASASLDQRLQVSESVLELDPFMPRLGAETRLARERELLRRVSQSALRCAALTPGLASAMQDTLAPRRGKRRETETADTADPLTLAEQIWQVRQSKCDGNPEPDRALNIVMAKIQRQ